MSPAQLERQRALNQLVGETEAMGDMMVRLNRQCYEKCSASGMYEGGEAELGQDETKCIDNCAAKFLEAQMKVGKVFMDEAQGQGLGPAPV